MVYAMARKKSRINKPAERLLQLPLDVKFNKRRDMTQKEHDELVEKLADLKGTKPLGREDTRKMFG